MYTNNSVSFFKVKGSDKKELKATILNSLKNSGCSLAKEKNIVIKPNMCYYWDFSTGHTTNPKFIAALIDVIRGMSPDAKISIVEADASAMKCKYAFKILGYEKLAEDYGINLVNLSEDKTEKAIIKVNGRDFSFLIPETIRCSDFKINVPKPKYMDQTEITCALKNIFGCNPEPLKFKLHTHLDEAIVAINSLLKFDFCLLDGLIVTGAMPRRLNLVMASRDPVAFDAAAARLMGVNPRKVKHLQLAQKMGLGKINYISKGDDPRFFQELFPKKSTMSKFAISAYKLALKTGLLKAAVI